MALLAISLSGCAVCAGGPHGGVGCVDPLGIGVALLKIEMAIIDKPRWERERKEQERVEQINSNATQAYEGLALKSLTYLRTVCAKDERLFIKPGIALDEGILLQNSRGTAPLALLETVPEVSMPAEITEYRKYHYGENREESARMFREIQYGYAVPWDVGNMLAATWVASPSSTAGEQKTFVESGQGEIIQRASKAFWERVGLRERVLESSSQINALRNRKSEAKILMAYEATPMWEPFDLPVDTIHARYALSIEDISTLEDRAHWVARGRLALVERESGETVAEYVGFAANTKPGIQKQSPSRNWQWNITEICPNTEKQFHLDRQTWTPTTTGFLQTVARAHGKAVPNFDALVPPELEQTPSLSRFTRKDGSIRVENVALDDFIQRQLSWDSTNRERFYIPTDRPLPSMVWRNVFLSRNVSLLTKKDEANATVKGNLLIEGVQGQVFNLHHISVTGDLTARDSEFQGDGRGYQDGFSVTYGAPHILFERVRGNYVYLMPEKSKDGKNNAQTPRNKQLIFRSYAVQQTEADGLHSDYVRIENATSAFSFSGSRIGTLEIIGSKLEAMPGNWRTLDLSNAEIDRLVITDSNFDHFTRIRLDGTRIKVLEIPDEALLQKFKVATEP